MVSEGVEVCSHNEVRCLSGVGVEVSPSDCGVGGCACVFRRRHVSAKELVALYFARHVDTPVLRTHYEEFVF